MRCLHVNIRKATLIVLSVLLNGVQHSHMAGSNDMDVTVKDKILKNVSNAEDQPLSEDTIDCSSQMKCNELHPHCFDCKMNYSCIYGEILTTTCQVKPEISCKGDKTFDKAYICRYCYQTETWEHSCILKGNCNSVASPRAVYLTNCTVSSDVLCLGNRPFFKNVRCNWTGGYRWSTAVALSITLGGFGADRFYLGHWQEGIGKLFSFGGLGVWTIIDVILISLHYLGPADGSLYI